MSMERQFLRGKVRVMTVSDQFPKGKGYLFGNVAQQFSNDQLISLGQAVSLLCDAKVVSYEATTTDHIAAD